MRREWREGRKEEGNGREGKERRERERMGRGRKPLSWMLDMPLDGLHLHASRHLDRLRRWGAAKNFRGQ